MTLDQLLQRCIAVFRQAPEISSIYAFGSYTHNQIDPYSDLDLTLVTHNPGETARNLLKFLDQIHAVAYIFVLFESNEEAVYMIFFKGLGLFKKLDLGITPANNPNLFDKAEPVYQSSASIDQTKSQIRPFQRDQAEQEMVEQFIGASRFVKYIKRGQPWLAYKFHLMKSLIWKNLRSLKLSLNY